MPLRSMKTKDPDTYARIDHALIQCLEDALSWLRDVVDRKRIEARRPAPNTSSNSNTATRRALLLAEGRQRAQTWAAQVLAKPKPADARTAMPQPAPDVMGPGDRVTVTWDRHWRWNTSTARMPRTEHEGSRGTILRTMACYVWLALDDTNEVLMKRKHNVTPLTGA